MIGLELYMSGAAATSFAGTGWGAPGSVSISDRARAMLALDKEKGDLIKEQLRLAKHQRALHLKLEAIEAAARALSKT